MKIDEFMKEIEEMQNFYKPKEPVSDTEKKVMFENLKNMKIERFKYIINHFYKTSKFMPKLSEILEINRTIGYSTSQVEYKNKKICSKCKNTGYIVYTKIIVDNDRKLPYEFMAICECGRQKQYIGEKNYTPFAKELNL